MSCEECGGPLPVKPYVWTCYSEDAHIWADHQFCSGVCRDGWLGRCYRERTCYRCQQRIYPDDIAFRYVPGTRRSEAFHRECV